MIRVYFSLLLLVISGVALLVVPETYLKIADPKASGALYWWQLSVETFAIPLCLILLGFSKHVFIRLCTIAWGLWLVWVSLWLLFSLQTDNLQPDFNGLMLVWFVLMAAASAALFTGAGFYVPKQTEEPPADSDNLTPIDNPPPGAQV